MIALRQKIIKEGEGRFILNIALSTEKGHDELRSRFLFSLKHLRLLYKNIYDIDLKVSTANTEYLFVVKGQASITESQARQVRQGAVK